MKLAHVVALVCLSITAAAAVAAAPTTRPTSSSGNNRVERLIEQLGAEDFKTRAAAAAQLRKIGRAALPQLKQTRHDDAEVESWCASLADQLDPKPRPAVAQLTATDLATFRIDGRLVEVQVGLPVINRAARGNIERLIQARRLELERDMKINVEIMDKVEAEMLDLRKKLERPIELHLNIRRTREAKPAEPAVEFQPVAR